MNLDGLFGFFVFKNEHEDGSVSWTTFKDWSDAKQYQINHENEEMQIHFLPENTDYKHYIPKEVI